jgi:hypothetical protein
MRGGARAGSTGRRARQPDRLTWSPLASTRSPAQRRQVVAPEKWNVRHSVEAQNVVTEWAHNPCPPTTMLRLSGRTNPAPLQQHWQEHWQELWQGRAVRAALAFARGLASAARWREEAAGHVSVFTRAYPGTPQPAGVTPLGLNRTVGVTASVCQRIAISAILCPAWPAILEYLFLR